MLEREDNDQIGNVLAVVPALYGLGHHFDPDVIIDGSGGNELFLLQFGRKIVQIVLQQYRDLLHIQPEIRDLLPGGQAETVQIGLPAAELPRHQRLVISHGPPSSSF